MSFVNVVPDLVGTAAGSLAEIGSAISAANAAAATPTTGLVAMASDEVSAAVTAVFAAHAQAYQSLGAQAAAFHAEFVRTLSGGAGAYASTELANAQQVALNAVNAPVAALLGRPSVESGAAASGLANAAESTTKNFNLPLGPLQLSASFTGTNLPDGSVFASGYASATVTTPIGPYALLAASGSAGVSTNGPVFLSANGTSPYGPLALSLNGNSVSGGSSPAIQFTSGSLVLPRAVPLLVAELGPSVVGGVSLANSGTAFITALSTGNVLGASETIFRAPIDYSGAILFGHTTMSFPNPLWAAPLGISVVPELNIPFGGVFAPAQPATLTWPTVNYGGATLLGSQFALQGTEFGGFVPVYLNSARI
jgi:PE family